MTLRDWFAGQIISGIVASNFTSSLPAEEAADTAAEMAYYLADAMLKERDR